MDTICAASTLLCTGPAGLTIGLTGRQAGAPQEI
jgi:hypothetical protein